MMNDKKKCTQLALERQRFFQFNVKLVFGINSWRESLRATPTAKFLKTEKQFHISKIKVQLTDFR